MRPLKWYWYDVVTLWWAVKEAIPRKLAWWVPEPVAYWVFIRMATRKEHLCQSPDNVTILDVLKTFSN